MTGAPSTDGQPPRRVILTGDALTRLGDLPESSIDCVITSPPYFRLRDYGHAGQLGLESEPGEYVEQVLAVMRQVARVLVPTGTAWLNLGDTYSTHPSEGAPRKSLIGIPERVLLELIADGWSVRNKLIWAKTNPIPSSVRDRLSCTYEVVYLLTRGPDYFFDLDAIRQEHRSRLSRRPAKRSDRGRSRPPARRDPGRPAWRGPNASSNSGLTTLRDQGLPGHPLGKNPGDVWQLATSRYRGAHFATYPEHLVARMLRAGCPEARCTACRMPHRRMLQRLGQTAIRLALVPTCGCAAASEPGLVLDPFLGSGTTAVVAEELQRDWLGIELSPVYVALARQRLTEARRGRASPDAP